MCVHMYITRPSPFVRRRGQPAHAGTLVRNPNQAREWRWPGRGRGRGVEQTELCGGGAGRPAPKHPAGKWRRAGKGGRGERLRSVDGLGEEVRAAGGRLACTRYCFTSKLYCGSLSSLYCPPPLAQPTLLQYYCTLIAQYTPRHRPSLCMAYTIQYR